MFLLLRINLDNLQLPETCNCSPRKTLFSFFSFCATFSSFAEYSLSAEYSAAFSCQIFAFGRNRKIPFRSITTNDNNNNFVANVWRTILAISCFSVVLQGGAQRPVHQITVGHVKIDALFDTGAESSLISSDV
jgi:hypothetical protein